jgi:hypothetical protein
VFEKWGPDLRALDRNGRALFLDAVVGIDEYPPGFEISDLVLMYLCKGGAVNFGFKQGPEQGENKLRSIKKN